MRTPILFVIVLLCAIASCRSAVMLQDYLFACVSDDECAAGYYCDNGLCEAKGSVHTGEDASTGIDAESDTGGSNEVTIEPDQSSDFGGTDEDLVESDAPDAAEDLTSWDESPYDALFPVCANGICETGENAGSCPEDCCVPSCGDKACGSNGCGSTCGTCGPGMSCNAAGYCVNEGQTCSYDSDCNDMNVCTADSCSGSTCSFAPIPGCGMSAVCANGLCEAGETATNCPEDCGCKPDCATGNKMCGPDGCGGTCGTCYSGQVCTKLTSKCVDINGFQGTTLLPSATYMMGCDMSDGWCPGDAWPKHSVTVGSFFIEIHEVSVEKYSACVSKKACTAAGTISKCNGKDPAKAQHPVNCVSWDQASVYCAAMYDGHARLPTEAEWEYAARGTQGRLYPWGDSEPNCTYVNAWAKAGGGECVGGTDLVTNHNAGKSPDGLMNLAGNVFEWVHDWYDGGWYAQSPSQDPMGPPNGSARVERGGGWASSSELLIGAGRSSRTPDSQGIDLGFRCVIPVHGELSP